jgi:SAM-dependent methyltransferase
MGEARLIKRWATLTEQPQLETLQCKVCGFSGSLDKYQIHRVRDIFHAGELVRYQCPTCDVIFGDLRFLGLPRDVIGEDYTDLYSYYREGDTTQYLLYVFNHYCNPDINSTYLDYACGQWNTHIDILRQRGYKIRGYDKYVSSIEVKTPPDVQYDCVFTSNFIEHVIDPYADLKEVVDLVKPGGLFVAITACFEYEYAFTHYHTFFFLGRSISYLEQGLGLQLIDSVRVQFPDGQHTVVKVFKRLI